MEQDIAAWEQGKRVVVEAVDISFDAANCNGCDDDSNDYDSNDNDDANNAHQKDVDNCSGTSYNKYHIVSFLYPSSNQ